MAGGWWLAGGWRLVSWQSPWILVRDRLWTRVIRAKEKCNDRSLFMHLKCLRGEWVLERRVEIGGWLFGRGGCASLRLTSCEPSGHCWPATHALDLLEVSCRAQAFNIGLQRWLALRLELLGACTLLCVALLCVSTAHLGATPGDGAGGGLRFAAGMSGESAENGGSVSISSGSGAVSSGRMTISSSEAGASGNVDMFTGDSLVGQSGAIKLHSDLFEFLSLYIFIFYDF